jgi:hypothetical protein
LHPAPGFERAPYELARYQNGLDPSKEYAREGDGNTERARPFLEHLSDVLAVLLPEFRVLGGFSLLFQIICSDRHKLTFLDFSFFDTCIRQFSELPEMLE